VSYIWYDRGANNDAIVFHWDSFDLVQKNVLWKHGQVHWIYTIYQSYLYNIDVNKYKMDHQLEIRLRIKQQDNFDYVEMFYHCLNRSCKSMIVIWSTFDCERYPARTKTSRCCLLRFHPWNVLSGWKTIFNSNCIRENDSTSRLTDNFAKNNRTSALGCLRRIKSILI
jgi:hypothetical protein